MHVGTFLKSRKLRLYVQQFKHFLFKGLFVFYSISECPRAEMIAPSRAGIEMISFSQYSFVMCWYHSYLIFSSISEIDVCFKFRTFTFKMFSMGLTQGSWPAIAFGFFDLQAILSRPADDDKEHHHVERLDSLVCSSKSVTSLSKYEFYARQVPVTLLFRKFYFTKKFRHLRGGWGGKVVGWIRAPLFLLLPCLGTYGKFYSESRKPSINSNNQLNSSSFT